MDNFTQTTRAWPIQVTISVTWHSSYSSIAVLMLHLDSFSAWISVDKVGLQAYAIEYSTDGKQATCWIPSEEGKVRQPLFTSI